MKVAIIDDSLLDRKLLTKVLRTHGFEGEILEAADGEEGLKLIADNFKDICLVLLDWQMPKMDGLELMKGVVKVPEVSSIPIVMITASSAEEDKKVAREANPGLAGYVVKPYKAEALIRVISPYLK